MLAEKDTVGYLQSSFAYTLLIRMQYTTYIETVQNSSLAWTRADYLKQTQDSKKDFFSL